MFRDLRLKGSALPFPARSYHIRSMAKSPKKPKLSTGKASKPELKPLDPYLAELLNPAVNREREAAEGFAERAQETFIHGDITDVDPALAKKLGLKGPDDGPDVADGAGRDCSLDVTASRPRSMR